MEQKPKPKWEGKATAKLPNSTADQIWPLLSDFFNLHKWLPGIDTCTPVEGPPGQPGCIRYCSVTLVPSTEDVEGTTSWAYEKLLAIDPLKKSLTYEVTDNNVGFKAYVATMKVVDEEDENESNKQGCEMEWSFVSDPVDGWKFEDLVSYIDSSLQVMAKKMEETLQATVT